MFDVYTNRIPFGLLTIDEQEKLKSFKGGLNVIHFYSSGPRAYPRLNHDAWLPSLVYQAPRQPKIETVVLNGGCVERQFVFMDDGIVDPTHYITFQTKDGEPDCSSIKMEEI